MKDVGKMVKLDIKRFFGYSYFTIIFVLLFFIMGIISGVIGVKTLTLDQFNGLGSFIDNGLNSLKDNTIKDTSTAYAIGRNLKTICKIWFLGLTIIGLPLVLAIIFSRGFVLGFTVGFLLENKGWQGFIITLLTILPQNLLHIPTLVLATVLAINSCIFLVKDRRMENYSLSFYIIRYTLLMFVLALLMLIAGLIEGYFVPSISKFIKF